MTLSTYISYMLIFLLGIVFAVLLNIYLIKKCVRENKDYNVQAIQIPVFSMVILMVLISVLYFS